MYLEEIARCAEIATRAHTLHCRTKKNATRKDSVTPFIVHPARVASLTTSVSAPYQVVCAAWLHDVLEDTKFTYHDLELSLNQTISSNTDAHQILQLVAALTKDESKDRYCKLNSTICKISQLNLKNQYYATTIKLADCIDNLLILDGVSTNFMIHHYIPETEYLFSELQKRPENINNILSDKLRLLLNKRKDQYGIRTTSS